MKSIFTIILSIVAFGLAENVRSEPVTLEFSGTAKLVESTPGATYDSVLADEFVTGSFTIGGTAEEGTFSAPDLYLFDSSVYYGLLTGDGIETSTRNSARPIEVSFENNVTFDQEEIELINEIFGTSFSIGMSFDLANIETDITIGDRRIEFGVNFMFLSNYLNGADYRTFPPLVEAELAFFFVVEERFDDEIFNLFGQVTEFGSAAPAVDPLIGGTPIDGLVGWYLSDWFGAYNTTGAPWLFHAEHGFIYRDPSSTNESMFVYDNAMAAWWWTSESSYPFVYTFDPPADNAGTDVESEWLYYFEGSTGPRSFGVVTGPSEGLFLSFDP